MAAPCPSCRQQLLRPILLQPGLPAHACPECSGVLLSLVAWRGWREAVPEALESLSAGSTDAEVKDNRSALSCPKCSGFMTKYRIAAESGNHIDYCAHCEEIWLDRGEWALLARYEVAHQLSKIFTQPWQSKVRSAEARQRQEQRFRDLFGPDYERARATQEWLADHSRGRELMAYLYLSQTGKR
jgi:Zn-finger nucleic acid-binding protein